jgi:hypothetical protein
LHPTAWSTSPPSSTPVATCRPGSSRRFVPSPTGSRPGAQLPEPRSGRDSSGNSTGTPSRMGYARPQAGQHSSAGVVLPGGEPGGLIPSPRPSPGGRGRVVPGRVVPGRGVPGAGGVGVSGPLHRGHANVASIHSGRLIRSSPTSTRAPPAAAARAPSCCDSSDPPPPLPALRTP